MSPFFSLFLDEICICQEEPLIMSKFENTDALPFFFFFGESTKCLLFKEKNQSLLETKERNCRGASSIHVL